MKNLGRMPATVNFQQAPTGRFDGDPKFRVFLTIISSERLSIGTPTVYVPVEGAECGLKLLGVMVIGAIRPIARQWQFTKLISIKDFMW